MLIPIQSAGSGAPLFLVHAQYGVCPDDALDRRILGTAHPVYGIQARGFDGTERPCSTVREMSEFYASVIAKERPVGNLLIGGFGHGSLVALDIARELLSLGRSVGPVLMIEPAAYEHPTPETLAQLETDAAQLRIRDRARVAIENAAILSQRPSDPTGPGQTELAVAVATATCLAVTRHVPEPFFSDVELILSADRAHQFFAPGHPWQSTLAGRRAFHVFDGNHERLTTTKRHAATRVLMTYLAAAFQPTPNVWEPPRSAELGDELGAFGA